MLWVCHFCVSILHARFTLTNHISFIRKQLTSK
jgi:hypothetical protein